MLEFELQHREVSMSFISHVLSSAGRRVVDVGGHVCGWKYSMQATQELSNQDAQIML